MAKDKVKKVSEKEQARFSSERAVFDQPVKAQRGEIHQIIAQGVTIEYTERKRDAFDAFKTASKPKKWVFHRREGGIQILGNEVL